MLKNREGLEYFTVLHLKVSGANIVPYRAVTVAMIDDANTVASDHRLR